MHYNISGTWKNVSPNEAKGRKKAFTVIQFVRKVLLQEQVLKHTCVPNFIKIRAKMRPVDTVHIYIESLTIAIAQFPLEIR